MLLSDYLNSNIDFGKVKTGFGLGLSSGAVLVSTGNFLNWVVINGTTGYNLVINKRSIQQSGASVLLATNFRNPSALTGATSNASSNRFIGGAALPAGISLTSGMQSAAIGTGTAGVPAMISPSAQEPFNYDILFIAPGQGFGISMGGPAANGLGAAQSVYMEITATGFLDPV